MSLTLHTIRRAGVVTGYEVGANSTEEARDAQIELLTVALQSLVPTGVYNDVDVLNRQSMTGISLQLLALLRGWHGDPRQALDALKSINGYMNIQRDLLMQAERRLDVRSAGLKLVPGYDYFSCDWEHVLHGV